MLLIGQDVSPDACPACDTLICLLAGADIGASPHVIPFLYLPAVVGPVKDGLPLAPPTFEIARLAVLPNRRHVPRDRPPASNLPGVVGGSTTHVVAAIPLEPPAWILRVDPSAATPDGERL